MMNCPSDGRKLNIFRELLEEEKERYDKTGISSYSPEPRKKRYLTSHTCEGKHKLAREAMYLINGKYLCPKCYKESDFIFYPDGKSADIIVERKDG